MAPYYLKKAAPAIDKKHTPCKRKKDKWNTNYKKTMWFGYQMEVPMTEREKMLAGELYDCGDAELLTQWHYHRYELYCHQERYNSYLLHSYFRSRYYYHSQRKKEPLSISFCLFRQEVHSEFVLFHLHPQNSSDYNLLPDLLPYAIVSAVPHLHNRTVLLPAYW